MSTRTYLPTRVLTSGGFITYYTGVPVGADNYVDCVQSRNDGKYVKYDVSSLPLAIGQLAWGFTYDSAIPTGSTIDSIDVFYRYASNAPETFDFTGQLWVSPPGLESEVALAQPTVAVKEEPPLSGDWVDVTANFTEVDGIPLALTFIEQQRYFPGLIFGPGGGAVYVDRSYMNVNFTLPEPALVAPTQISLGTNGAVFKSFVDTGNGANVLYPTSVWFEWTEADPSLSTVDSGTAGVAKMHTTPSQSIVGKTSSTDRYEPFSSTIPSPFNPLDATKRLLPNKTYWVRAAASNADNTVRSAWTSFTTTTFDTLAV